MKHKAQGFNIIELMIAITLSAAIISTMISSFSKLYSLFMYNAKFLAMNSELRLAVQVIKNDTENAGVFGTFSFHDQSPTRNTFQIMSSSSPSCRTAAICDYDSTTVGVKSLKNSDGANISNPDSSSDILKVQSGGYKVAYLSTDDKYLCSDNTDCLFANRPSSCNGKYYLGTANFNGDDIESKSSIYMLASANHIYELKYNSTTSNISGSNSNLTMTLGCPSSSTPAVVLESYIAAKAYDSFDPDIHSMVLTNLNTTYFYVKQGSGSKPGGLYVVKYNGTNDQVQEELVSRVISKMTISYVLDNATRFNNTINGSDGRFTICDTKEMNNAGNQSCGNRWDKIVAVNITLTGEDAASKADLDHFQQEITETVGWKS